MEKRIEWLDGIKGLSSLGVFFHHFLLAFLPAIYFGASSVTHMSNIDVYLSTSPILFMVNGNYLVCLFCIIAGILMSYKIMTIKKELTISSIIIKRYLRLSLPIFFVSIFVFILMKLNLFYHLETASYTGSSWLSGYYLNNNLVTLWDLIYSSFVKVLLLNDVLFSNAFWMLKILFLGSFMSIILGQIYWEFKKKSLYIYIIITLILLSIGSMYALFSLGSIIAYILINKPKFKNKYIYIIIFILGLFLGGYPSPIPPDNIYKIFDFIPNSPYKPLNIHMVGAFLTIVGIMNIDYIKKLLSLNILKKLNKISLSIYLIHIPLLYSFSSKLFNLIYVCTDKYLISVFLVLVITLPVLIILSHLFTKYIEKYIDIIINKVIKKLKN